MNIFEDSMNPATNKLMLNAVSSSHDDEDELKSLDDNGEQKFFLTAAAVAETKIKPV